MDDPVTWATSGSVLWATGSALLWSNVPWSTYAGALVRSWQSDDLSRALRAASPATSTAAATVESRNAAATPVRSWHAGAPTR
jgi:hypothetical protein